MKIHDYVICNDIQGVEAELANGVSIDAIHEKTGLTPFQHAFRMRHNRQMLSSLLRLGATIDFPPPESEHDTPWTELILAIWLNDVDYTRRLLDEGANINYHNEGNFGILIRAVGRETSPELFELLLERGAPIGDTNNDGESPLDAAYCERNFDVLRKLLAAGGDPAHIDWTPLHCAILSGTLEDVEALLKSGADIEARDFEERTPWLLSVFAGEIEKAKLLLDYGADKSVVGFLGQTPLLDAVSADNPATLRWLLEQGFDVEGTNEFAQTPLIKAAENGRAECVRILLEFGARLDHTNYHDPYGAAPEGYIGQRAIEKASTLEVMRILLDEGEEINDINDWLRTELIGLNQSRYIAATDEEFESGKHPRFGTANPEKMDMPYWNSRVVRLNLMASGVRYKFDNFDYSDNSKPFWSYDRFGKSLTELPDGRFIEIAGEHEDFYDPNFNIYNDVFVHYGDGRFDIYGYPREVFQPTDFHSATLVREYIYIIGNLGYPKDRLMGQTPVYRLNIETFAIEKVESSGENPGWIYGHRAKYNEGEGIVVCGGTIWTEDDGKIDYIANTERFVLDLASREWRKIQAA